MRKALKRRGSGDGALRSDRRRRRRRVHNADVASTRREVHLQRKRSSHFQWPRPLYKVLLVSCRRFYSTVRPRLLARSLGAPEKGSGEFTVPGGKLSARCINPLFHDERPGVGIIIYARDAHARFTATSRFKMDRHFFSSSASRARRDRSCYICVTIDSRYVRTRDSAVNSFANFERTVGFFPGLCNFFSLPPKTLPYRILQNLRGRTYENKCRARAQNQVIDFE